MSNQPYKRVPPMKNHSIFLASLAFVMTINNAANPFSQTLRTQLEKLYKMVNRSLKEPSPELKAIAMDALAGTGFENSVTVYEENGAYNADSDAFVFTQPFLVLSTLQSNDAKDLNEKIFKAHKLVGNIVSYRAYRPSIYYFNTLGFIAGISILGHKSNVSKYLIGGLAAMSLYYGVTSLRKRILQYEKESDLYACERLLAKKKIDPMLEIIRSHLSFCLADTYRTHYYIRWNQTFSQASERARFIAHFLANNGINIVNVLFEYLKKHQQPLLGNFVFDDQFEFPENLNEQDAKIILKQTLEIAEK